MQEGKGVQCRHYRKFSLLHVGALGLNITRKEQQVVPGLGMA